MRGLNAGFAEVALAASGSASASCAAAFSTFERAAAAVVACSASE
jgi:hypothetical protein